MIIYLDESGDLGFNFVSKKPSNHFVITLLVCGDHTTNKALGKSVERTLKNKVNHKANKKTIKHELKGTETTLATKQYFYKQIACHLSWEIYSIILDKNSLYQELGAAPVHRNLYNNLARRILEEVIFTNNNIPVRLIVDRSKNTAETKEFNQYVADHLASLLPLKTRLIIEHQASSDNPGLQAVDLFSWGIFKKYELNDTRWYQVYNDRIKVERLI